MFRVPFPLNQTSYFDKCTLVFSDLGKSRAHNEREFAQTSTISGKRARIENVVVRNPGTARKPRAQITETNQNRKIRNLITRAETSELQKIQVTIEVHVMFAQIQQGSVPQPVLARHWHKQEHGMRKKKDLNLDLDSEQFVSAVVNFSFRMCFFVLNGRFLVM